MLEGLAEEELLVLLPRTLRDQIARLNLEMDSWDKVGAVLGVAPTTGIALKGGTWEGRLWEATKMEFRSFLCTDSTNYEDLRREWAGHREKGMQVAVGSLSGAIGAHLGVAGGILTPIVVWLLVVAIRIGKNALCQSLEVPDQPPAPPTNP